MNRLVIIGGSDAGISAALRAKEIDAKIEITVIVADRYPNFSICGLPFYISGEVQEWQTLAHRTMEDLKREGIRLLLGHHAESIDPKHMTVAVRDFEGRIHSIEYDKLILATGAISTRPGIRGIDLPGVFLLRSMDNGFALQRYLDEKKPASVAVIGGGYIGMEMADAFSFRGMKVMVIEYANTVLTSLDPDLGMRVEETLKRHGVDVMTRTPVKAIEQKGFSLQVLGENGFYSDTELVLVAAGVRPNVSLAVSAGVNIGGFGAIGVNRGMKTNAADIYAAGDCVETWHRVLGKYVYMPLGTTAHKQGRIAGENAAGGNCEYQGSLGTQVVKIFDLVAARTGLRDSEARAAGFDPCTIEFEGWDHKVYYPGPRKMEIRMTGDRLTHRLLGVQIVGDYGSEISKRVDIIAAAIYNKMKINEISDLDLSYTPPLSSPWDPMQAAAHEWMKRFSRNPLSDTLYH